MSPEAYREQLLAPLARRAGAPSAATPLPPAIWFPPAEEPVRVGLRDLYAAGVRCGHGESLAALASEVASYDARLEAAQDAAQRLDAERRSLLSDRERLQEALDAGAEELEHTQRAYQEYGRHLESELDRSRARTRELEQSTFWRLTYPLRSGVHGMKLALRSLRGATHQARLIRPRIATARHIAREQGLTELGRRLWHKAAAGRSAADGLVPRPGLEARIGPLEVAASDEPLVSVVIPTYGQDLHTFTCLKALAAEALRVPIEVIVMDDCAPQPAADALREVRGVRFVRNQANLGFVRNCNAGVALARGRYVLFLNNDAVVAPGCLEAMLRVFDQRPDAGGVGAKLVYPDGRLQEAGAIVWRDGSAWNDGRGQDPRAPGFNYLREADYCSAACLLVPRELLLRLGAFDERYVPAYCEDADLCFRIREAGFKVYYQPAAEAVHFEGVSHGTSTASGVKQHQVENQARFFERWRGVLASHRVNGVLPRLERDRNARWRVLFIEACMLTPDHDSGSLRTWRLIEEMHALGCKVTFVAENLEKREPYVARLQQMGVEVLYAPYVTSIRALVEERGSEFDVVILARYYVAAHYIASVRRHAPQALLVLDTIDLHFLRQRRLAALQQSASIAQSAEAIYRQEIDCIQRCDVTWVVSDVEREILGREVPLATVMVQSNVHEPVADVRPFAAREGIVFVGGYRHPPNVDAALFLAREIVPLLRERLPGVKTWLLGSNAPRAILELECEGLEVVGYVPEIEPWLDRCRLSISPLRYGAGVKGKVNQAMSRGLPVVATSASIEGMHLAVGEEVLVADEPSAFADAIVRAYTDEALWNRLSRGGLANVERHFSRAVARASLEELLRLARKKSATATSPAPRAARR
ncbi:MAG TPA: glycosyltransferase [Usitatibacter sp.]|nr:glycosyltransferase [Usitatibacter sp.]